MVLVATMTALVLGLLLASAKTKYDNAKSEMTGMAAEIVLLDRMLAAYGPETAPVREQLHDAIERMRSSIWPDARSQSAQLDPSASGGDAVYEAIQLLSPQNESQRALKSEISKAAIGLGRARWLLFAQSGSSISTPLLLLVTSWLTILFLSLGLFAPANSTVVAMLMVVALSVSSAIFMILELDRPFDGPLRISSEPLDSALSHLGR